MHNPAPPFAHSSGPKTAKIAIVGEAWGEQEDLIGKPFVGSSGQELTRMLQQAGITRRECFLTNVLAVRPPGNNLASFCGSKAEVGGKDYPYSNIGKAGEYLRPEFFSEIERLRVELNKVSPNIVVAAGAAACWALLGTNKIGKLRGTVARSSLCPTLKVLPTYHPSAILRNWALRPITIADLMKVLRESVFPEIRRPSRKILYNPSLDEISNWMDEHFGPGKETACDIETKNNMIEMVGFSAGPFHACVIPFLDLAKGGNYWPTAWEEKEARKLVKRLLESRSIAKIFQNGLYDIQFFLREGYLPRNCSEDTMLLHHSLFPEMQKGLGFLGSIYTDEPAWKLMRGRQMTEMKKDD